MSASPVVVHPLAGLRVVDLCVNRAGSVAGGLLADLGARVARVETVAGDHRRPHPVEFPDPVAWDRGKDRVIVDTLEPGAGSALGALLDQADVVLVDGTPAAVDGGALDPDQLRTGRDQLVVVWLPPYGARGQSYRDLPADPLLLAAMSGYAMYQPAVDATVPIAPVIPVPEYVQGSLGASAAVAGVLERERSGLGQVATISGVDAVAALLATLVNDALDVDNVIRPGRNAEVGPSFRSYRCSDGEMLFLATLVAPLFFKALEVLDGFEVMLIDGVNGEYLHLFNPEYGQKAARLLEQRFAARPRQHWLDRFEAAGVPAEAVQSRQHWLASERFAEAVGRTPFEHPVVGAVEAPGHPVRLSRRGPGPVGGKVEASGWPNRADAVPGAGPLVGLRVVDLANFVAAPYAPAILAFWGADVVKVETPDGDPYRLYTISYLAVNQGKRSAVLDLRTAQGRQRFDRLLASADVLVDNLRPVTRETLDLDDEVLAGINPALVHARITAFDDRGPAAGRPGFDPSIQALSGMMVAAGGPAKPLNTTTPVHDVAAAASLALGILSALWHRLRTGAALKVSGSLASASALLQRAELTTFAGRPAPTVGGLDFVGSSAGRRFYRAEDGWVALAARSPEETGTALIALGVEPADLNDDASAGSMADAIAAAVAGWSVDRIVAIWRGLGIPASRVVGSEWGVEPHLDANGFSHLAIEPTFGRCRVMRGPGEWSRSGTVAADRLSSPGADTDSVIEGWS